MDTVVDGVEELVQQAGASSQESERAHQESQAMFARVDAELKKVV
jgi:hypothetical protein